VRGNGNIICCSIANAGDFFGGNSRVTERGAGGGCLAVLDELRLRGDHLRGHKVRHGQQRHHSIATASIGIGVGAVVGTGSSRANTGGPSRVPLCDDGVKLREGGGQDGQVGDRGRGGGGGGGERRVYKSEAD
jgi:hypothetical protein